MNSLTSTCITEFYLETSPATMAEESIEKIGVSVPMGRAG